jgi:hypothetical protein
MFPTTATVDLSIALSPICDMKGDITVNIVSTPCFPASPLLAVQPPESKLCMRLFEDDRIIYSSDWTTDSEPEVEENELRWSATP